MHRFIRTVFFPVKRKKNAKNFTSPEKTGNTKLSISYRALGLKFWQTVFWTEIFQRALYRQQAKNINAIWTNCDLFPRRIRSRDTKGIRNMAVMRRLKN